MKWFKHNTNASEREFLAELEDKFGLEGYARWFKILEKIGGNMGGENGCSVALPWTDWQRFLKGKRNKLETFLVHLENKTRINRKQNGNIMEIECHNMLKIRDDYSKKSVQSPGKVAPRSKSKEVRVKIKEKHIKTCPKFYEFQTAWEAYPSKIGKTNAERYYRATVKKQPDHARLMEGMRRYTEFVLEDGRPWLNGSTFFNQWQDWFDFEAPKQPKKKNSGPRTFSPEHEAEMKRISDEAEAEEKANGK